MSLFGLFSKKKQPSTDANWIGVVTTLSGTLWHLMHSDPKMLASPFARVVLRDDWSVGIAVDKREPDKLLGPHDVSFVFLHEDRTAFADWIRELKADSSPVFQQIATEQYAKKIVRAFMANAKVVD